MKPKSSLILSLVSYGAYERLLYEEMVIYYFCSCISLVKFSCFLTFVDIVLNSFCFSIMLIFYFLTKVSFSCIFLHDLNSVCCFSPMHSFYFVLCSMQLFCHQNFYLESSIYAIFLWPYNSLTLTRNCRFSLDILGWKYTYILDSSVRVMCLCCVALWPLSNCFF